MKCAKCHSLVQSGWRYCTNCGKQLVKTIDDNGEDKVVVSKLTVKCGKCQTQNSISHHYCFNCGNNLRDDILALSERLSDDANETFESGMKEEDSLDKAGKYELSLKKSKELSAKMKIANAQRDEAMAAFASITRAEYKTTIRSWFFVSAICLPLQVLLLLLAVHLRQHSFSTANTIFVDGIIFSGSANILSFLSSLILLLGHKLKRS